VRESIGKRRAVVEDELRSVGCGPLIN